MFSLVALWGKRRLALGDVERAIATRDPQSSATCSSATFAGKQTPEPGRDELDDASDEELPPIDVPPSAITFDTLSRAVSPRGLAGKNATERKLARREAFDAAERSPFAPPRLRLGAILKRSLRRAATRPGDRAALLHAFAHGSVRWGLWRRRRSTSTSSPSATTMPRCSACSRIASDTGHQRRGRPRHAGLPVPARVAVPAVARARGAGGVPGVRRRGAAPLPAGPQRVRVELGGREHLQVQAGGLTAARPSSWTTTC